MPQNIWVIIQSLSEVKGILAKEALKKVAQDLHKTAEIVVIKHDQFSINFSRMPKDGDALLLVNVEDSIKKQYEYTTQTSVTLEETLQAPEEVFLQAIQQSHNDDIKALTIVAVTSCPTGIAHTFMAAEGLQTGAEALGINLRVETQGSVGAQDALTEEEIQNADIVIIAADREVDRARFNGKRIYSSNTKAAIHNGEQYIQVAIKEAILHKIDAVKESSDSEPVKNQKIGPYKHLMTGVSFMIPFVVAGGLLIALAFALGGINAGSAENAGTLAHALSTIGGLGFSLMVPALAGYIAFSIADRPGLAPGMIGGLLAAQLGAGFLGGIIAGFLAGYIVLWLNNHIRLSRNLDGLKPVLILPLLGTVIVGLIMVYVIGEPVSVVLKGLESWLKGMEGTNAFVLGAVIGGMMAVDLGGPVN
ncbi:MAG: PTS fructose transporter subunit IIC, partial [Wohlfahrtiimonas sp.]